MLREKYRRRHNYWLSATHFLLCVLVWLVFAVALTRKGKDLPRTAANIKPSSNFVSNIFPESLHPLCSAVIITRNLERRKNVGMIVQHLLTHAWIREITVWNNGAELFMQDIVDWVNTHRYPLTEVRIVNSLTNEGTLARYMGCSDSSYPNCLTFDDDWFPVGLSSLRSSYVLSSSRGIHIITDASTRFFDISARFNIENTSVVFGFGWVGVASLFSRETAVAFMEKWNAMKKAEPGYMSDFQHHEDFFFTLHHQTSYPVVLETSIMQVKDNDASFSMSRAPRYQDFFRRGFMVSLTTAIQEGRKAALANPLPSIFSLDALYRISAHKSSPYMVVASFHPVYPEIRVTKTYIPRWPFKDPTPTTSLDHLQFSRLIDGNDETCLLADHIRSEDFIGIHSPWPFRVHRAILKFKTIDNKSSLLDALTGGCIEMCTITNVDEKVVKATLAKKCRPIDMRDVQIEHSYHFVSVVFDFKYYGRKPMYAILIRIASSLRCDQILQKRSVPLELCEFQLVQAKSLQFDKEMDAPDLDLHFRSQISSTCIGERCSVRDGGRVGGAVRQIDLIIGITTTPSRFDLRQATRRSWMRMLRACPNVEAKFLLGPLDEMPTSVLEEAKEFGDLEFMKSSVNYSTLIIRSLEFFQWVNATYDATLVMKTNDDSYINIPSLMTDLMTYSGKLSQVYYGHFLDSQKVYHNPAHKNYEPMLPLQQQVFLPYASGAGYVIGRDILRDVFLDPTRNFPLLRNEDAAIGNAIQSHYEGTIYQHSQNIIL